MFRPAGQLSDRAVNAGVYDAADTHRFFVGANYVLTDKASGVITDSIYVIAASNSSGACQPS